MSTKTATEDYPVILIDDAHRATKWLRTYDDCLSYVEVMSFEKKEIPFVIRKGSDGSWAVYKHMPAGGCDCLTKS